VQGRFVFRAEKEVHKKTKTGKTLSSVLRLYGAFVFMSLSLKGELLANPKPFPHPLTWFQDLESKNIALRAKKPIFNLNDNDNLNLNWVNCQLVNSFSVVF